MAHFSGLPFDDIKAVIAQLKPLFPMKKSSNELAQLAAWFYAHSHKKRILKPFCVVFMTSHGFIDTAQNAKTKQRLNDASNGNSALNKLCAHYDIGLKAFDLAIDYPPKNAFEGDVFQENECAATIAYGMEAIAGEPDLVVLSSVSEGGEKIAKGIIDALPTHNNPLELLRQKGGRDIAALLGAIIAARMQHVPLILDGLEAKAAYELLKKIDANVVDHCLFPKIALRKSDEGCAGVVTASLVKAALSV
jgi:nicotinate-nucleotide--dimethylbenzimidazole phosphoribosyltransferase